MLFTRKSGSKGGSTPSIDLKTTLVLHIAAAAISCLAVVTVVVLWDSARQSHERASTTADLVARHLSFQLLRINAGFDASNRYPDWDTLLASRQADGQCVQLVDQAGAIARSDCVGSQANVKQAPDWFAALWAFIASNEPAQGAVSYKDTIYGTVVVSSEPKVLASFAWAGIKPLLILTVLTIFAVSGLVYLAVARALAPTKDMIAGLNALAAGDFAHRLPPFKLYELQRISQVSNALADKIEHTLAERAELSSRLMNAHEDERRNLARELHDELGQSLTAMAALAASLEKSAQDTCPELREEAGTLAQVAVETMQSLRGTLTHLRPADLEKFGLKESLAQLVNAWKMRQHDQTRFEMHAPNPIPQLSDAAAAHVFRIAQEGLTNAAKHACAHSVRLSLEPVSLAPPKHRSTRGVRLTIEDDGVGRRTNGNSAQPGMGLLNMRERVAALGGDIAFDDRPGGGLTVRVVVPAGCTPDASHEAGP
jgi:two-component system, NarL family, sensor histidine kinase UhpB